MYDQFVTAVAAAGSSVPFEDLDVDNVVEAVGFPRLLEVVLDLGRNTRRRDAVAPFLSLEADADIGAADADAVVTVDDDDVVRATADVNVTVDGVDGGDVDVEADADDLRRKRFISGPIFSSQVLSQSMMIKSSLFSFAPLLSTLTPTLAFNILPSRLCRLSSELSASALTKALAKNWLRESKNRDLFRFRYHKRITLDEVKHINSKHFSSFSIIFFVADIFSEKEFCLFSSFQVNAALDNLI